MELLKTKTTTAEVEQKIMEHKDIIKILHEVQRQADRDLEAELRALAYLETPFKEGDFVTIPDYPDKGKDLSGQLELDIQTYFGYTWYIRPFKKGMKELAKTRRYLYRIPQRTVKYEPTK